MRHAMLPMLFAILLACLGACAHQEHCCTPTCCPGCCAHQQAAGLIEPSLEGRSEVEWAATASTADGPTRQQAVDMLVAIGPSTFCHAMAMLDSPEAGQRFAGAEVLRRIGPPASGAAAKLGAMLMTERETIVRAEAAHALEAFGREGAPAVPALAHALRDGTWSVRFHAANALGVVGWQAWECRNDLENVSHHDLDLRVRDAASYAGMRIEEDYITHAKGH